MARTLRSDRVLFLTTLLLVAASVVMVYSASAVQAQSKYEAPTHFLTRQLIWGLLGFALMLATMRIDYHTYRRPALIWTMLGIIGVGLVVVLMFPPINNARRWMSLAGISLQPSEFAKLGAIAFTAALLERRMHRINDVSYSLVPIGVVVLGLVGLIMLEPDFGTSIVIIATVIVMAFAAGLNYRYLAGVALMILPAAMLLVVFSPYRLKRMMSFLNPWDAPLKEGYQTVQSLIAVGSGGVLGKGLMNGMQKLFYLPESHTDYIYAVIGEEFGLIGTTAIVICFAIIAWRGLRVSLLAPDRFGSLLALGITAMVSLQAFVNMSVVIGMLPPKGIPLPFVSNGGSSLLVSLVAMGVLLNISQQASPTAAAIVGQPWPAEDAMSAEAAAQ